MGENNGTKSIQIMLWMFAVIVFPTLFFIGNKVIANEDKRVDEDQKIRQELKITTSEQTKVNQDILVMLTEIKSDVKYLKEKK